MLPPLPKRSPQGVIGIFIVYTKGTEGILAVALFAKTWFLVNFHQKFQVPKMEESWALFSAILGVGFPLHKPYPYSLYHSEDTSVLGTK